MITRTLGFWMRDVNKLITLETLAVPGRGRLHGGDLAYKMSSRILKN